ncbi:hypothetical protein Elgi_54880 [Paenibacillus elgii]|uniref:hypothetical protein n=1 Tax=Paenibacillus elgii TaxID=189691 RepID=UPI002D7C083B|nr:hypothetical protein Elgi_54880 [Paenibacillus elgii]
MRIQPTCPEKLKALLAERSLVLFGAGSLGIDIAEYCDSQGIPVDCFADNNVAGKKVSKNILSPQQMKDEYPNANIVVSSNIFFDEIKLQLVTLGYPEEQILSYKLFLPEEVTWKDLDGTAEWERMRIRVKKMSEWIDEGVRSVVDYGAGEMYLKTLLPPEVKYFPVDYIRRSEETILCDLNAGNFPNISADITVLSGVLELLTSAESLLRHVCATTAHRILLTYMTLEKFSGIDGRRASAYVNDFTEYHIVDLLARQGFVLKAKSSDPGHDVNTLFLFEKSLQ